MASSSTSASPSTRDSYHVFINHRGCDVKKTFAGHLYSALLLHGLRAFLDNKELRVGDNFPSQIIDAIANASVHVGIFSERYAESEWCLRELVYMLDSGTPIIPVFYHVEPAVLRWTQGRGLYAEALGKLEEKKTRDPETHEEKRRYDPSTIEKWREALSRVSEISGLDLQVTCNGDEGELVRKIVQHVLERIKSMAVGISMDICRAKKLSRMTEKLSENLLAGVVTVSDGVTAPVVGSKAGQKFFRMLPGDVLLASLDAFKKVLDAAEVVGRDALSAASEATVEIVANMYCILDSSCLGRKQELLRTILFHRFRAPFEKREETK